MLEKIASIKSFFSKGTQDINLSSKERLYSHWHKVLIGYAVANVVFISISVLIMGDLATTTDYEGGSESAEIGTYTAEELKSATQIQRYKQLVQDGVVQLPVVNDL